MYVSPSFFFHPVALLRDSGISSSPSSATWFVRGGPSFYGSMIGESLPSFPSACLGPLVRVSQDNGIDSFGSSRWVIHSCLHIRYQASTRCPSGHSRGGAPSGRQVSYDNCWADAGYQRPIDGTHRLEGMACRVGTRLFRRHDE